MDVDFWPSRPHSSRHLPFVQSAHLNYADSFDDSSEEDDRAGFSCPFCYIDIDVHALCIHLQEEHCFDLKNAVCPLCASNLGKDVIGHFISQHTNLLKHKRKYRKSGSWTGNSPMLIKELSSFLESPTNMRESSNETAAAPNSVLSSYLCTTPQSHPKDTQQDNLSSNKAVVPFDDTRTGHTVASCCEIIGWLDGWQSRRQDNTPPAYDAASVFTAGGDKPAKNQSGEEVKEAAYGEWEKGMTVLGYLIRQGDWAWY